MDEHAFDGRSLLRAFLDLRAMTADVAEWTETHLSDNPPRLIRLRRLKALFRAFEIPWDPSAFIDGSFIQLDQPRYATMFSRLVAELPEACRRSAEGWQLSGFFATLYGYREELERTLSFGRGLMEASGLYLDAHGRTERLNRVILENIDLVERPLVGLINPEGRTFTMEDLVRDHSFPTDDLFMIDADWW